MKNWKVDLSSVATNDMRGIRDYIVQEYGDVTVAESVLDEIEKLFDSLTVMPYAHRLHPQPQLEEENIRYIATRSYVVLYSVDGARQTVRVHRIVHHHQNTTATDLDD